MRRPASVTKPERPRPDVPTAEPPAAPPGAGPGVGLTGALEASEPWPPPPSGRSGSAAAAGGGPPSNPVAVAPMSAWVPGQPALQCSSFERRQLKPPAHWATIVLAAAPTAVDPEAVAPAVPPGRAPPETPAATPPEALDRSPATAGGRFAVAGPCGVVGTGDSDPAGLSFEIVDTTGA